MSSENPGRGRGGESPQDRLLALLDAARRDLQDGEIEAAMQRLEAALGRLRAGFQGEAGTVEPRRSNPLLVGSSPAIERFRERLELIAASDHTVTIRGETGSGKELAASLIHERSARGRGPFVKVSCAGIHDALLESELFGHVPGAFTGADRLRRGPFELADGGTLLLDEVAEMSPRMQSELLRVIQSGELRRVGSHEAIRVDVRVMATTQKELLKEARSGRFRLDLFYRLNVLNLELPPLRERGDDLPALIAAISADLGFSIRLDAKAHAALRRYDWPGNLRELENLLRRQSLLGESTLGPQSLPQGAGRRAAAPSGKGTLEQATEELIQATLLACHGNRTRAARELGISRRTLFNRLKRGGSAAT